MKLLISTLIFTLSIFTFAPPSYAIPLSETNIITIPATGDLLDGITKKLELHPFGKTLDESISIRFKIDKMTLPQDKIFKDHLGIYLYDPEEPEKKNQYLGGKVLENYLEIKATKTGVYFAAIMAPKTIEIQELTQKPTEGIPFTISTKPLKSFSGEPLWDKFPFWIEVRGGSVPNAKKREDNDMYEVFSTGDQLNFQVQANSPGDMVVFIFTPLKQDGGDDKIVINVLDDGAPLDPPTNLKVEGNMLSWTKPSTPFMAYFLYYRERGETEWNGTDYQAPNSPIAIAVNPYKMSFKNPIEITYELSMTSFDAVGNQSPHSEIITYIAPETENDIIGDLIRKHTAENEAKLKNAEKKQKLSMTNDQPQKDKKDQQSSSFFDIRSPLLGTAVNYLSEKNIINGYPDGSFQPDRVINRAETLKILLEAKQISVDQDVSKIFPDVDPNLWFAKYVNTAKKLGLIKGYTDGSYRPTQEVNRAEFIKIAMTLQSDYQDFGDTKPVTSQYSDLDTKQWYMPYLNFAYQRGFLPNSDRFKPTNAMTRGDAAIILYKVLTKEAENKKVKFDMRG